MLDQKRVLIVDDSFSIRHLMQNLLARQGAHPDEASTGQEALDRLDAGQRYDLILLDLLLPDMSGLQVLQRIRERDRESAIVILTAFADVKTALEAVRHGADGYLQKQEVAVSSDYSQLFYALEQAWQHRMGLLAQEQLDKVKGEFYSMVAHDLRNPVGQILGITELLLELEPLSPAQRELLSLAQTAAHRLLELANDYLDFAQIDSGYLRLDLGPAELGEIVRSSAALAEVQTRARRQTLHLELPAAPIRAWVDARRIGQVVDNLLSNAIKYTPEGGQIWVRLREEGGEAILQVADTGFGIPAEQIPSLFSKYHRVPGEATRGVHGAGLGLLIVKEIVQAHGGRVWAESEGIPGKGTTFTVVLPLLQEGSQNP